MHSTAKEEINERIQSSESLVLDSILSSASLHGDNCQGGGFCMQTETKGVEIGIGKYVNRLRIGKGRKKKEGNADSKWNCHNV